MIKKYFKYLSVLVIICCISFNFSSCGKGDSNNPSEVSKDKLVGKWKQVELKIDGVIQIKEKCEDNNFLYFKADGTYDDYDACSGKTKTGKYRIKDNQIFVIDPVLPIEVIFQIKELTSDRFVYSMTFIDEQVSTMIKIK